MEPSELRRALDALAALARDLHGDASLEALTLRVRRRDGTVVRHFLDVAVFNAVLGADGASDGPREKTTLTDLPTLRPYGQ